MNPTLTPDLDVKALADAISAAATEAQDETNGKPAGSIVEIGCEENGYDDPVAAAASFITSMTTAAITTYLARLGANDGGMRVKAIGWQKNGQSGWWSGELLFNICYVIYDEGSGFRVFSKQLLSEGSEREIAYVGTADEAKAAAQADFNTRILSTLRPTPTASVSGEKDAWNDDVTPEAVQIMRDRAAPLLAGIDLEQVSPTPATVPTQLEGAVPFLYGARFVATGEPWLDEDCVSVDADYIADRIEDDNGVLELVALYAHPAALSNQSQAGGEWVLVPKEPTHKMKVVGHSALDDSEHVSQKAIGSVVGWAAMADVYRAMIAAAPANGEGK